MTKHTGSQARKVLVIQWCFILCDPMDCSPSGSSVHGILQARILEWGLPDGPAVKNMPANTSGTRVRSLVQEDSTCCRAIKPVSHNEK